MATLAQLRQRFYQRFDENSQAYIGKDEATSLVNEGGAHLYNWLVSEGENYLFQETMLPLVAGQAGYTLPTNFMKMLKVFAPRGTGGQVYPLPRIMPQEYRGPVQPTEYARPTQLTGYMLLGQTLRIVPTPQQNAGALTLWWCPQYTPMVLDTDTTDLSIFAGADEFIVNHAVIGAGIKEQSDTTALERRQAQIQQMIQQALINRDMGQHAHVVDAGCSPW